MKLTDIHLRDPFVLPLRGHGFYHLFGSTDDNAWSGSGNGCRNLIPCGPTMVATA